MATIYRSIPDLTPQEIERFWSKVDKTPGQGPKGECWLWTEAIYPSGYGRFWFGGHSYRAHRIAYFLATGDRLIEPSIEVCHSCDFRACVSFEHLWKGTRLENHDDMKRKGRGIGGNNHGLRKHPECAFHGETHHSAKLNHEKAEIIRARWGQGETMTQLGREYGISVSSVKKVVSRATWKNYDQAGI